MLLRWRRKRSDASQRWTRKLKSASSPARLRPRSSSWARATFSMPWRSWRVSSADGIPYAILGGMALNAYGYRRVTVDVDVLLTPEGLEAFRARHLGLGYVQLFSGSKSLRDTENGVPIDVVLAGEYPGDGRPKPVAFPDPAVAAVRG